MALFYKSHHHLACVVCPMAAQSLMEKFPWVYTPRFLHTKQLWLKKKKIAIVFFLASLIHSERFSFVSHGRGWTHRHSGGQRMAFQGVKDGWRETAIRIASATPHPHHYHSNKSVNQPTNQSAFADIESFQKFSFTDRTLPFSRRLRSGLGS